MTPRRTKRPLFLILRLAPNSSDDRDPSMTQNEFFFPYSFASSLHSCFWFSSAARWDFLQFLPILSPLLPLRLNFSMLEASEWICEQARLQWVIEFIPSAVMWTWWGLCPAPCSLGLVLSSASTKQAYFVLRFPMLRWFSLLLSIGILQGIAAGIGPSNFLPAAFIVSLFSSSFGSMQNIPLYCLALSSFGFSIVHFCFAFFFGAQDICFHISGHTFSRRDVVCFLVSLSPDHVYPSGGLSLNKKNLLKLVHASDNSFSPSTFQQSSRFFSNNTSIDENVVLVTSMYFNGVGNDSSLGTVWLWVQRDDDKWILL